MSPLYQSEMTLAGIFPEGVWGDGSAASRHAIRQQLAAALSTLASDHMEPDLAAMVLDSLGLTVVDLEAAGADPYDFERLQSLRCNPLGDPY